LTPVAGVSAKRTLERASDTPALRIRIRFDDDRPAAAAAPAQWRPVADHFLQRSNDVHAVVLGKTFAFGCCDGLEGAFPRRIYRRNARRRLRTADEQIDDRHGNGSRKCDCPRTRWDPHNAKLTDRNAFPDRSQLHYRAFTMRGTIGRDRMVM